MALNSQQHLRMLLGEDVGPGDSDEDSLFKDAEIEHFLESTPNMERAAYEGWRVKAARLSNLVDTTEGNAQRKYKQMFDSAQDMLKVYGRASMGATEGRTRIGNIRRPAVFGGN